MLISFVVELGATRRHRRSDGGERWRGFGSRTWLANMIGVTFCQSPRLERLAL